MSKRLTHEEFVGRSRFRHGDKYEYSDPFIDVRTKVRITCPVHGDFEQRPYNHMRGGGCPTCSWKIMGEERIRRAALKFVKQSNQANNNKYTYDKMVYVNNKTHIIITCPIHGDFKQHPYNHIRGAGCPVCSESQGEKDVRKYLEHNNIKYEHEKNFNESAISSRFFDFFVLGNLIEYHGTQHYIPSSFGSKQKEAKIKNFRKILRSDRVKRNWCKSQGIPLLIIPYWDKDRIPEILDDFLNNRTVTISNPPTDLKYIEFREKFINKDITI